ncbi:MAG TPA: geranylgeranyl reductase family protein [Acidimicrobiales bacterium]
MRASRFDVLVVGAGPAGAVAATVLARGGARVGLLDKATFPRDKACGDLIGPRGVQLLTDLGLPMPPGPRVGPMLVVGPTGRRVRLPNAPGLTYPGHGVAATRSGFDASLHQAAVAAGVTPLLGRADQPRWSAPGRLDGFMVSDGQELGADFVIGADGATSRVAAVAGLVDGSKVLWGFAIRVYHPQPIDVPAIVLWEPERWQGFPGYGWVFPGADGGANLGLGVGTGADRQAGAAAVRAFPQFIGRLRQLGLVDDDGTRGANEPARRLGGWLKMGMVGTTPAAGRVLLVGDAAGLVNPLQGEGIAQAMQSGRWAAEAILHTPGGAAVRYRARLAAAHLPYQRVTAALQAAVVSRPRAVAALARLLTGAGRNDTLAGGWAVFWNELLDGAPPGSHRAVAALATHLGNALTVRTPTARWFATAFDPAEPR